MVAACQCSVLWWLPPLQRRAPCAPAQPWHWPVCTIRGQHQPTPQARKRREAEAAALAQCTFRPEVSPAGGPGSRYAATTPCVSRQVRVQAGCLWGTLRACLGRGEGRAQACSEVSCWGAMPLSPVPSQAQRALAAPAAAIASRTLLAGPTCSRWRPAGRSARRPQRRRRGPGR